MNSPQAMLEVSEVMIASLKWDINFHQRKALEASRADLPDVCAAHLRKQEVAIKTLTTLGNTYSRVARLH